LAKKKKSLNEQEGKIALRLCVALVDCGLWTVDCGLHKQVAKFQKKFEIFQM